MKDRIKLDLSDNERTIIIKALNLLRNYLKIQERSTDFIDEIILKVSDKSKLNIDTFDFKIIINALNTMRYKLKSENQPRGEVNDILLKLIDETEGKKTTIRKENER